MSPTRAADLRRWFAARRAGAEHERSLSGQVPDPEAALAAGFDVIDFAATVVAWPIPEDPVTRRLADRGQSTWRRLRERMAPR